MAPSTRQGKHRASQSDQDEDYVAQAPGNDDDGIPAPGRKRKPSKKMLEINEEKEAATSRKLDTMKREYEKLKKKAQKLKAAQAIDNDDDGDHSSSDSSKLPPESEEEDDLNHAVYSKLSHHANDCVEKVTMTCSFVWRHLQLKIDSCRKEDQYEGAVQSVCNSTLVATSTAMHNTFPQYEVVLPASSAIICALPVAQPCIAPAQPFIAAAQPFIATAQPFIATAQPFVATAQPFVAAAQPFFTAAQPFVAAAQPFTATPAYHPSATGALHLPIATHPAAAPESLLTAE
ncbi:hypothetical protein C8Q70DRAFT_1052473 [Cubamyces menziesii]|nr:hypothetical protein C8Q70DRAFT_1052473 [Cubamyces menziesii]